MLGVTRSSSRFTALTVTAVGLVATLALAAAPAAGQAAPASPERDAMIRSATSAAPAEISAEAAVRDWEGHVLREGSNGWTCLPDMPDRPGNSPMCLDDVWMRWADAWMNRKPYGADRIGFGYMLQGDMPTSNVDPYGESPTPDNQWIEDSGPHVMILVPDAATLEGLPRTPHEKGPWVMWDGTSYVHIMVPIPAGPRPARKG